MKTGIFATGTLALGGSPLLAKSLETSETKIIDLSPILATEKVSISGKIIDAHTLQQVTAQIKVTAKTNTLYSSVRNQTTDGQYQINVGFSRLSRISQKVLVQITADGYKPYSNYIYLTKDGCNIHGNEWDYNPNFNEVNCPENLRSGMQITSLFDFRLVKH